MLKKDILFVGVGEAGNRIVNEILSKDRKYVGLFINSSYRDLENLEYAKSNVYTMPNSEGTGKNRKKSKQLLSEYRHAIIEEISKYKSQKIITFVFSMGGGTGGGSVPSLIKGLSIMGFKKPINVICVIPSYNENPRYRKNAIECWNELVKIDNINTFYVLDNNKREDKNDINKEFAEQFDEFMNMPFNERTDDMIDEEELGVIGLCKGSTVFYKFPDNQRDVKIGMAHAIQNSIFADLNEDNERCEYLAMATNKNGYNQKLIEKQFGIKEYAVSSYTDKINLVVASGYRPQKIAIEMLEESLKENQKQNNINSETFDDLIVDTEIKTKQDIPVISNASNINEKDIQTKLNDDALWDDIFNM